MLTKQKTQDGLKKKLLLLFFGSFFLVGSIFDKIGILIVISIFVVLLILSLLDYKNSFFLKEDFIICSFIYILPLFFIGLIPIYLIKFGSTYIEFVPMTFGRLINVVMYLFLFIVTISLVRMDKLFFYQIVKAYLFGCYVLFFFSLWQVSSIFFPRIYFPFETRSFIHSIENPLQIITSRNTSIMQEPAYYTPFLINSFLLLYFFYPKKKVIRILILFFLVMTFSLSAYSNFILIFFSIIFFDKSTYKRIFLLIASVLSCVYFFFSDGLISNVLSRLNPEFLFQSSRLQEIYIPLFYTLKNSPLFGFGPKGYIYVAESVDYLFGWRKGEPIINGSVTSHFFLADFFIEYGIIGVLCFVFFFLSLFFISFKKYKETRYPFSLLMCIAYFVSSMYEVNYAAPGSVFMLVMILGSSVLSKKEIMNCQHS